MMTKKAFVRLESGRRLFAYLYIFLQIIFRYNSGRRARRIKRFGSPMHRQSHSAPSDCIVFGARLTFPAHTSSEPPSPINKRTEGREAAFSYIHRSCAGVPKHTKSTSGALKRSFLITARFSALSFGNFLKYP